MTAGNSKSHAASIVAAAQKQAGRHPANSAAKADDQDVLASLQSMGAISAEQPDSSRAGRVRLKGFEQETAKQKAASESEVIASLKAMGIIGDEEADK